MWSDAVRINSGKPDAGFTLIELLVSIAIIALLITLVTVGVSHVAKVARGSSERLTVVQMNQAVQAFKQEFGFLPPFVTHNDNVRPVEKFDRPVPDPDYFAPNTYRGLVTTNGASFNANTAFLEGFSTNGDPRYGNANSAKMMSSDWAYETSGIDSTAPDYRFSEYSLAYFLVGALPKGVDGVDGPGMFKPRVDGSFDLGSSSIGKRVNDVSGRAFPAFVDPTRKSPKLDIDLDTYKTQDKDLSWRDTSTGQQVSLNVRSRLLSPAGKAYRYYRWAPREVVKATPNYYDPATGGFTRLEEGADRLNVPSLLGDPRSDADLRGAEYAIVSCGPDGYFGDMNLEAASKESYAEMVSKLNVKTDFTKKDAASFQVRKAARSDNIVEVGR